MRTYFAVLSLGAAGSALARPGYSYHANLARVVETRQTAVPAKEPVAAAWFASWHAQDYPLANVSWSKLCVWPLKNPPTAQYSLPYHSLTTPDVNTVNITDPDVFKDFVSTAHANVQNCSAAISVGGWTGSQYFSTAVATAENRTAFVKTLTNLVQENKLDGLDFDWEYPGLAGIGCNTKSPSDTSNFLAFLTELRTALPNTTFSAATSITPFVSSDQATPSTDVSGFASVLDYVAIMNYDIWGPWSTGVGPNAPLNDTCVADETQKVGSAVSAVNAWMTAGIPADQLVLAVAAYGHGFSVSPSDAFTSNNTLVPYPPFNTTFTPQGDAWDDAPTPGAVDVCGTPEAVGGNWDFWGLIAGGFLNQNGTVNTAGAAKGAFIKSLGLRGFAMWEAGGDYDDILLDSIRSSAGFEDPDNGECGAGGEPTSSVPAATGSVSPTATTPAPTSTPDPDECEA
ncbi:hypothetical protein FRC10_009420 [Ceratobasidium sp. 414]|nr:hypothetical protein FRC10_009420 [Ceratobasidium sp. 414]